ncbi:carboxypeptidase-like regulatory domain-containing protein [Deinococcus yavapaiensis]|uniref:Carboxypeptidase family protein n=1 Tax=Deinococcus yavapaiensis KR-236 TaxID=694435 RepID=A0A318S0B4_9DEIO|nr:carboxypeptidase-like regulatory domain-containing protein [Deinococcus yavapaiensis]PYE50435.1 carboxypeptidase family protein [Deinococcus yavapaiensis KR-236]
MNRRFPALLSLLALTAGLAAPTLKAEPMTVKGTVVDASGNPIKGAIVRIEPGVTGGMVTVKTDAQGQYTTPALIDMPYYASAWVVMPFQGQKFCMRVDSVNQEGYEPFSPRAGVIRNFKFKLSGPIPDGGEYKYFGGEARLMRPGWDESDVIKWTESRVQLTLVPNGPLADGSKGKTLVKTTELGDSFLYDIPLGSYTATAVEIRKDGTRFPLLMGKDKAAPQMNLKFESNSPYCGAGYSRVSSIGRAFLYVARFPK